MSNYKLTEEEKREYESLVEYKVFWEKGNPVYETYDSKGQRIDPRRIKDIFLDWFEALLERRLKELDNLIDDLMPDGIQINFEEDNYASGCRDTLLELKRKYLDK